MKTLPMVDFPQATLVKLSEALQKHKEHRGAYAKYTPKGRVACDECVNVLHEAKGEGQPPLGARVSRRTPLGVLRLCNPHGDLWREIDGIGEKRGKAK